MAPLVHPSRCRSPQSSRLGRLRQRDCGSSCMGEVGFQTLQGSLLLRFTQSFGCHCLVELEESPSAVFLVNASPGRANDSREDVLHLCDE